MTTPAPQTPPTFTQPAQMALDEHFVKLQSSILARARQGQYRDWSSRCRCHDDGSLRARAGDAMSIAT